MLENLTYSLYNLRAVIAKHSGFVILIHCSARAHTHTLIVNRKCLLWSSPSSADAMWLFSTKKKKNKTKPESWTLLLSLQWLAASNERQSHSSRKKSSRYEEKHFYTTNTQYIVSTPCSGSSHACTELHNITGARRCLNVHGRPDADHSCSSDSQK